MFLWIFYLIMFCLSLYIHTQGSTHHCYCEDNNIKNFTHTLRVIKDNYPVGFITIIMNIT